MVWSLLVACRPPQPDPQEPPASTDSATPPPQHSESSPLTTDTGGPPIPPGPHNVLLVLLDDLGAEKIGAYGENAQTNTPVIDGLAGTGMLFMNAWSYPTCTPTRAALQSGRHGRRTGIGAIQQPEDPDFVADPRERLLPGLLSAGASGWSTAMYGKWHLQPFDEPLAVGWSEWAGSYVNLVGLDGAEPSYYAWRKTGIDGVGVSWHTYATVDTTDDAIRAVTTLPEPWLVHVSYNAPHLPYEAPPPELHTRDLRSSSAAKLQYAMLEAADTELGRLLSAMDPEVRAHTTVFVLGDNGSPGPLLDDPSRTGGKGSLFDSGIRVPFLVSGPLVRAPGTRSEALVSVVDVVPTLLEVAGVDARALPGVRDPARPLVLDGRSLLPVLGDPERVVHATLFADRFEPNGFGPYARDESAIRDQRYKLIRDRITGKESFHRYGEGGHYEGRNLLQDGLGVGQQEAYERLSEAMDAQLRAMAADEPLP